MIRQLKLRDSMKIKFLVHVICICVVNFAALAQPGPPPQPTTTQPEAVANPIIFPVGIAAVVLFGLWRAWMLWRNK